MSYESTMIVLSVARCTFRERAERKLDGIVSERLCGEQAIVFSGTEARCYDHAKMCETCHQPSVYGTHNSHPAEWPSLRDVE